MQEGAFVGPSLRLVRKLSEGGMGSIWIAEHRTLGVEVAVKFIASDMVGDRATLARFQREATAAAQLKSPHVVLVFDHGVTGDEQPYIVMELLHGEDLDAWIARVGRLSLAEISLVLRHACKALAVAHRAGIVHRDIKPANLFVLDSEGEPFVKVLDFGIAKRRGEVEGVASVTTTGAMVGTPHYMSPEQIESSRDVGPSADLWALAVVAYHCLVGRRPFEGETVGGLCVAISTGRFLPPRLVFPDLPASVDAWFARALARDPRERFATAKELSDAFVAAVPLDASSLRPAQTVAATGRHGSLAPTMPQPIPESVAAASVPQTLAGAAVRSPGPRRRTRGALVGAAVVALLGAAVATGIVTRPVPRPVSAPAPGGPPSSAAQSALKAVPPPAQTPEPAVASAAPGPAVAIPPSATHLQPAVHPRSTSASPASAQPAASRSASYPSRLASPPAPALPAPVKDRGF